MRNTRIHHLQGALPLACAVIITLLLLISAPTAATAQDKLKAEDVIAKHLEAIGPEAARVGVQSLVAVGTSHVVFKARNETGAIDGRVVFASESNKVLLGMAFGSSNYPGEKFGYDGKKFTVGYLKPGVRSTLGSFVLVYGEIFKEGLMGGSLSSAWPLLKLAERKAKVEYAGTDKIGEQSVYKLKYFPNKGSDLQITLYFDAKTFQHVRTQYDRVTGSRLGAGGVDNQASQRAARYRLTEDFSDFKQESKLTLPHSYKLQLEIENTGGNSVHKWEMSFDQFAFNEPIEENSYNVESN